MQKNFRRHSFLLLHLMRQHGEDSVCCQHYVLVAPSPPEELLPAYPPTPATLVGPPLAEQHFAERIAQEDLFSARWGSSRMSGEWRWWKILLKITAQMHRDVKTPWKQWSRVEKEKEREHVLVPSEERSLWRYYDDGGGSAWIGNNTCHRPRVSHVVSQSVVDAVTDWWWSRECLA